MAARTTLIEIGNPLLRLGFGVRIMATRAAHLSLAFNEASAGVHLLDMAHGLGAPCIGALLRHEHRPHIVEQHPWPKIGVRASKTRHYCFSLQMALRAHMFAAHGIELLRIDDRVRFTGRNGPKPLVGDMLASRSMAALATDRHLLKDRLLEHIR